MLFLRLFRLQNLFHTAKDQIPKCFVERPAACNRSDVSRLTGTQFVWQHSEGNELPRVRNAPGLQDNIAGASAWTKKFSGTAFGNSAVKPVSSGDFFNFTRLIAKCNASNVYGCEERRLRVHKGNMCLSNVDLQDPAQKLINFGINVYQLQPSRAATSFSPKRL